MEHISEFKKAKKEKVIKVKEDGDVTEERERKSKKNNRLQLIDTESNHIIVKGFMNYIFEGDNEKFCSLKKGNVNLQNVELLPLPLSHPITQEKNSDVDKLLKKMFGNDWATTNDDQR
ncbi:hypothetical protein J6590_087278 [Homalodisca vitripennis]|nr:hypothetical protein J6590_082391 [Homalodisca vitripennis]KAG8304713.1 hypothetical protein J6590_087278 [Homalodisca vitripennis]